MKKLLISMFVCSLLVLSCGSGDKKNGEIILKVNMDASVIVTPDVFAQFEKDNPGIKVEIDASSDMQAHYTKMMTLISANEIPDVFISQSAGYINFVEKNVIMNLKDELKTKNYEGDQVWEDSFIEALLENGRDILKNSTLKLENHDYGVPYMMTSIAVAYDKKLFAKLNINPPKTWSEFIQVNEKLKNAGYVPLAILNSDCIDWFPRIFWDQYCREKLDKNPDAFETGQMKFTDSEVKQALIEYKKMWDMGYIDKNMFVNDQQKNQIAFVQKKVAQYYVVPEALKYVVDNMSKDVEISTYTLPGIAGLPPRSLGGASILWHVSATTKHKDAAVKLLKFLTSRTLNSTHPNFKYVIAPLKTSEKPPETKILLDGFTASAINGFSPEIYVPAAINAKMSEVFKFDLIPNYLLGKYDINKVVNTLQDLYNSTYLDKK